MFKEQNIESDEDKLYITNLLQESGIEVLCVKGWLFYLNCYNLVIEVGEYGCRMMCEYDNKNLMRVYFSEEVQGSEGCCCFINGTSYTINTAVNKSRFYDTPIEKIIFTILNIYKSK